MHYVTRLPLIDALAFVQTCLSDSMEPAFKDIACGNGQFSRRMADLGARVVAFDFSEAFIDRARARSQGHAGRIEYLVLDATDRARLMSLGTGRFDAICTMARYTVGAPYDGS